MRINHDVLLVPMQPTPNGCLHIGHGAGTYLRADVIARALRAQGHRVAVITGSDVFEDWVVAAAQQEGRTPDETHRRYHTGIKRDLDNLSVTLDAWIDPAGQEHRDAYQRLHQEMLAHLRATGAARPESERIPYSERTGDPVVGPWIAGECPNCGQACGGSTCTFCGDYFVPEQVVNARSRLDDSTLTWRTEHNWFARPPDPQAIADRHRAAGLRPVFLAAVTRAVNTNAGRIRLTGQGTWGIRSSALPPGKIISNGYFLYSVYCGEIHRTMTGAVVNPFFPDSGVTTVGLFGNDNSTPGLICPDVIAQGSQGMLKPFDAAVVNGMLHLEGRKCSTSKRHGIWLSELLDNTSLAADELRFALLHAPLDHGTADLSVDSLVDHVNTLRSWHRDVLRPAVNLVRVAGRPVVCGPRVRKAVAEQYTLLGPCQTDLAAAVGVLSAWMDNTGVPKQEWLAGLALLAWPLLPGLAEQLWSQLGYAGHPELDQAWHAETNPRPDLAVGAPPAGPLSTASVRPFVRLQSA